MTFIELDPSTWADSVSPTQTGSQDSSDITNDVNVAIQSLNDVLNTAGFIQNTKLFITAMEEFGQGLEAALACVSVDMAVVASGVKAAAAAFSQLETTLAGTLTQIDQQLAYFTSTTSSVVLATPTDAEMNALLALRGISVSSGDPGVSLSFPKVNPSAAAAAGAGGLLLLGLGLLALA